MIIWNDSFSSSRIGPINDVRDGSDGPLKSKDEIEFLASELGLIKEHKKMLEQHDLFGEASSLHTI